MYLLHYVSDVEEELTTAVRAWAKKAKADGKIRLFGIQGQTGDDFIGLGIGEFKLVVLEDKNRFVGIFHQEAVFLF